MNEAPLRGLLVDPEQSGAFYLDAADLPALRLAALGLGFLWIDIDLAGCVDKAELLRRFAAALRFPEGFGHNWDALEDSLRDLAWLAGEGYVLGLSGSQALRAQAREDYDQLVAILEDCAEDWRERHVPFWSFIALDSAGFAALPG